MPRMNFGAHMSIAGGVYRAFARGEAVGCRSMQIFVKNERQWQGKPLSDAEIRLFHAERERTGITPILAHASYLINLATPDAELWERSIAALADEVERCRLLGVDYLVLHPGAHTGSGSEAGIARVAQALNRILASSSGATMILLENTAGQGSCLGGTFEELAAIIAQVEQPERLGVCLDTCHLFAAGYDIRQADGYATTIAQALAWLGQTRIHAFHLNDSQGALGSRRDRHAHIGEGQLGLEAFALLVNDPRFQGRPMILETPKEPADADLRNLARLREICQPIPIHHS